MDNIPLISIVTITYNAESEIGVTVQSVAQQSFRNFEHIIVDGASKDNTLFEAKKYADNLRILSERDKGLYDAMNKGMSLAKGEYLIFLNAGDTFADSDTLAAFASVIPSSKSEEGGITQDNALIEAEDESCFGAYSAPLTDSDPDIIYGDTIIVDEARNYLRPRHLSAPPRLTVESFSKGMLICHQAFCVKKSLAPKYDLQYRFSADYDWTLKCIKGADPDKCVNLNRVVIHYLDAGLTEKNKKASLMERFKIMQRHYGIGKAILRHATFIPRAIMRKLGINS